MTTQGSGIGNAPADDISVYVNEYAREGRLAPQLYDLAVRVAAAVIFIGHYPTSYSPTGRWDRDDVLSITHEWIERKLLRTRVIEHLLLSNTTVRGLRKGFELSFTDFLIGQRRRSIAANLFTRADQLLESDERFRPLPGVQKRADRVWALSDWHDQERRQVPESDLLAASVRVPGPAAIRYRADAKKFSPILLDRDLADLLASLLAEIGAPLTLAEIMRALRHRFSLYDFGQVSLDQPAGSEEDLGLADVVASGESVEDEVLIQEAAEEVLRELSPRRQRVLYEYSGRDATLTTVAAQVGCSKSTVENELRAAMETIARHAPSTDEARALYNRVLDLLGS